MIISVNHDGDVLCGYFALCENVADGYVDHVIGPVPTCQRCADKAGQTLHPGHIELSEQS